MPDTASITVIKKFTYRDQGEEWSNTYHFSGPTPADSAAWKTLADAIIAKERTFLSTHTKFVRAYGYEPGNESSVWQWNYEGPPDTSVAGVSTWAASAFAPGDAAMTVRWYTGELSSPGGKKIYCRKYFHDVEMNPADPDEVAPSVLTSLNTFGAGMIDGSLPAGRKYCGPQGAVLSAPAANPYITTRTLKRRGKRPPTSA